MTDRTLDAAELARLRERELNRHELGLVCGLSFPELSDLIDALEKAWGNFEAMSDRAGKASRMIEALEAERDSARALLRECDSELPDTRPARALRARIAQELEPRT